MSPNFTFQALITLVESSPGEEREVGGGVTPPGSDRITRFYPLLALNLDMLYGTDLATLVFLEPSQIQKAPMLTSQGS